MRRLAGVLVVAAVLAALPPTAQADMPGPSHAFAITREGDPTLPDHTIFHPTDLDAPDFKLPIVAWANGGCRDSNEEFHYFLTHFAAYGYFIVANGPPENPYHPEELTGLLDPKPEKLIASIDWALKQNVDPQSKYFDRLDPHRIALMGQSCGGWETTDASSDPRVVTSAIWNSGTDAYNPTGFTGFHAPVLYAYGGNSDYVNWDAIASYNLVSVPAVLAEHADAGHTGFWDDPTDGPPPGPYQNEPLVVAQQWLAFTLYGDPAGKAFFLGDSCGLCSRPEWTVQSKGDWAGFKAPADSNARAKPRPAGAAAAKRPARKKKTTKRKHRVHRHKARKHRR